MEDCAPGQADNTVNNGGRDALGRFTAGNSGRPPRAVGKIASIIRQSWGEFLENRVTPDDLDKIYLELSPREKFKFLIEVSKFFVPALKEISKESDRERVTVDYSKLSEQALKEVLAHTSFTTDGD
ncbi:MAG: hypothetical protein JNN04_07410 [Cyclobacteriaceae bacterium]|nr:hypothetical protein [Cyclobacteriaceae bacterium]